MLSIQPTGKEWTILLTEQDWELIVSGLLKNQLVKTNAGIQSGDTIFWACEEGNMYLSRHPHQKPLQGNPEKCGIKAVMKHVETVAAVVWRGNTRPDNPLKRGWLSIDFLVKQTTGTTEEEMEAKAEGMQHALDTDPASLKRAAVRDGAEPKLNVVK